MKKAVGPLLVFGALILICVLTQSVTRVVGPLLMLGALIFIHELGHFLVAKLVGIKVIRFSIGFPPGIIKRKWGETEYVIGSVPLGGYVKLLGEDPESQEEITPEDLPRAFTAKSVRQRMAVIVAGPMSNFVLAVLVLIGVYMAGLPVPVSELGQIVADTPAAAAGLKTGDRIVAIDGEPIWRWEDMQKTIQKSPEKTLVLTVERNGEKLTLPITPALSDQKGVFGEPVGRIGVASSGKFERLGPIAAINEGCRAAVGMVSSIGTVLVKLVRGQMGTDTLGGPIMIVQASGETLMMGGVYSFLSFLCFMSINLAIINLLPIPILDGGHLFFLTIEGIIGRPVTGKIREAAMQVGLLMLVSLMAFVIYKDIYRIWTKGWNLIQ